VGYKGNHSAGHDECLDAGVYLEAAIRTSTTD